MCKHFVKKSLILIFDDVAANLTGDPAPIFYIVPKKYRAGPKPTQTLVPFRLSAGRNPDWSIKATFHFTISMRAQRATSKIQRNDYHHGSCGHSLTGKTMSVFLIFSQETNRNVKNRWVRGSLHNDFYATNNAVD